MDWWLFAWLFLLTIGLIAIHFVVSGFATEFDGKRKDIERRVDTLSSDVHRLRREPDFDYRQRERIKYAINAIDVIDRRLKGIEQQAAAKHESARQQERADLALRPECV